MHLALDMVYALFKMHLSLVMGYNHVEMFNLGYDAHPFQITSNLGVGLPHFHNTPNLSYDLHCC